MNAWAWFHVCYRCFLSRRPLPGDCQETNNIVTWSVPEWRPPRHTCLLSWSCGWTSLPHQWEAWQPPPVTEHVESFTPVIIRSHPPEDTLELDQSQEETPQNHLHSHSGKMPMILLAVCNVYLLHIDVIWQLRLWVEVFFFLTGRWNPTLCFCVSPTRICCPTFSTRETLNQPFLLFSLPFCWPREATSPGDGAPAWQTPWLLPPKTSHAVVMGNHVPCTAHTWGLPIRDRFRPGNRHRRPQPPSGTCNACKTK